MKMYILVREKFPLGHQANCAAHASLGCYLKFQNDPNMRDWLEYSFRKVTCAVTDKQFEAAKRLFDDYVIVKEDALNDAEIAIAFCPREEYDDWFSGLRLFGQTKLRFWWYKIRKWLQTNFDFSMDGEYTSVVHSVVPLDKEPGAINRCVQTKN